MFYTLGHQSAVSAELLYVLQLALYVHVGSPKFLCCNLHCIQYTECSFLAQAKIFGIPIHSWAVYSAMVLTAYVMFILIQTNNYGLFDPVF